MEWTCVFLRSCWINHLGSIQLRHVQTCIGVMLMRGGLVPMDRSGHSQKPLISYAQVIHMSSERYVRYIL